MISCSPYVVVIESMQEPSEITMSFDKHDGDAALKSPKGVIN